MPAQVRGIIFEQDHGERQDNVDNVVISLILSL